MTPEFRRIADRLTEVSLEHACPFCQGQLELRLSPEGARTVCATCQTINRAEVRRTKDGLAVDFTSTAKA
jgi:hypothetical protein